MFVRDGEVFDINVMHVIGGNQYPVGWFFDADLRAAHGVEEVYYVEPPAITSSQKLVPDGFERDDEDRWVQKWLMQAKSADELTEDVAALAALKVRLVDAVDAAIATIYSRWIRFEAEYVARETAARAFVAAGYEGDPGVWVSAFATATGMSNEVAADTVIAQADGLRGALQALGALRMAKYGILSAADSASAQAAHDSIVSQASAIAGAL